jgi:hypothetical protein
VLFLNECAREPCLAPDRAAILVLRDTTPRQAARQVKANVRRHCPVLAVHDHVPAYLHPWSAA